MGRDFLSQFGQDTDKPQAPVATRGGVMEAKERRYSTPVGPTTFGHNSPGLAERNNYGNAGSQGKYDLPATSSGSPGITPKGGENKGEEGSQHG